MTDFEISRLLFELQQNAKRLNEATDSINQIILSIERKIVDSQIGLECWLEESPLLSTERKAVDLSADDRNELWGVTWTETHLGFAKIDQTQGWRLAVRKSECVESPERDRWGNNKMTYSFAQSTALWQATRELRIGSLELMPKLLIALRDKAGDSLKAVERAKKLVD